jgi:hypothetical protein
MVTDIDEKSKLRVRSGLARRGVRQTLRSQKQSDLHTKDIDQGRKGSLLLPPTRIVEEETRKGLTSVFYHSHQSTTREMRHGINFRHVSKADIIECSADDRV